MRTYLFVVVALAGCGRATGGDDGAGVDAARPDAATGPDGTQAEQSKVYAHSPTELYRIDSNDLSVHDIGPFGGALDGSSMTDIAVDKDGNMVGVSLTKIWDIDPATGTATMKADFSGAGNLTSLSFVPVDGDDPNSAERLVTAGDQGDVYEIDPSTGATTLLGNYGTSGGQQIISSGDIVSVRGLGTLATVNVGTTAGDYLAWIDPTTWAATPIGSGTGKSKIFGLGFWGGTIFGFIDNGASAGTGSLVTIDKDSGVATLVTTSGFRWYGAGVTTTAPIVGFDR